jgi:ferrochelatase
MNTAVILMAYGSPAGIDDIPAYLADIREGKPVSEHAVEELKERYRRIGGHSPLDDVTEAQRAALERELGLPVYVGMKHWRPRIASAVDAALAGGAERIVGVVLAPHYSRLSIAGYRAQLEEALAGRAELRFVASWHNFPPFIDVLSTRVRGTHRHVVFTAHSLPARVLETGDPYQEQLFETSALVAQDAGVADWSFSYQSESPTGEPWLGPDILDHLVALKERGVTDVLVCPVGFVSDHLEIRWDIDIEAQERARELGMDLERIAMPNADPAFIEALALLVEMELVGALR